MLVYLGFLQVRIYELSRYTKLGRLEMAGEKWLQATEKKEMEMEMATEMATENCHLHLSLQ